MPERSRLLKPGSIGKVELKNRIVVGAMGNPYGSDEGYISDRQIQFYVERARGGAGLIISTTINVNARTQIPRWLDLHHDRYIDKLRGLSTAVHKYDAKICAQLMMRTQRTISYSKEPAFLPSPLPFRKEADSNTGASLEEIANLVEDFAEAARRAKDAGFDGVEFHGCHGMVCVLSTFLSPFVNRRTDKYGGTTENRSRLACEVVARTRQKVGPNFPIIFRLNGQDGLAGGTDSVESVGQSIFIEKAGADAISVSSGIEPWAFRYAISAYPMPYMPSVPYAEAIKKSVKVPVLVAGKMTSAMADEVLRNGKADFIVMARPLLADPYLVTKLKEGRSADIRNCIYCNNCMEREPRRSCTLNPFVYAENEWVMTPATSPKKCIVVGGGLGGMKAAEILALRGHKVTLYEKSRELGGQFNIAARQPGKEQFKGAVTQLSRELNKLGVEVRLGLEADGRTVAEQKPDVVIIATGASPATPDVPGVEGKNVIQANDVITGKAKVGNTVAVIGGRHLGMEMAIDLANEGKKVTLITRRELGRQVGRTIFFALKQMLMDVRVPIYQNAPVVEIRDKGVYFLFNGDLTFVEADTVVLASGAVSEKGLADDVRQVAPGVLVYEIGDCKEPRNARMATYEATEVSLCV